MEQKRKQQYRLIKSFFVISEEAAFEHALTTRKNVLSLVKHGFTREEIYYMPIGEYLDYINILNEEAEVAQSEINSTESNIENKMQDIKMAGNTMPKNFF